MAKRKLLLFVLLFLLIGCSDVKGIEEALKSENYENCTVETVLTMKSASIDMNVKTTLKIVNNYVYAHTETDGVKLDMYLINENDKYYSAMQTTFMGVKGEFVIEEISTKNEVEALKEEMEAIPNLNLNDFEKGKDGFYVLKEDKTEEYLDKVLSDVEEYLMGSTIDEFNLKFKVENNRLSVIVFDLTFTVENESVKLETEMTYSDFDKTSIKIPNEIKTKIN